MKLPLRIDDDYDDEELCLVDAEERWVCDCANPKMTAALVTLSEEVLRLRKFVGDVAAMNPFGEQCNVWPVVDYSAYSTAAKIVLAQCQEQAE